MPYADTYKVNFTSKTKIWYRGRFGDLMYRYE